MSCTTSCSSCTGATVSASILAASLSACVAAFIVYLVRHRMEAKGKANIRSPGHNVPTVTATISAADYEDVKHDNTGQKFSAIDTKRNIAYGQAQIISTTVYRDQ